MNTPALSPKGLFLFAEIHSILLVKFMTEWGTLLDPTLERLGLKCPCQLDKTEQISKVIQSKREK